MTGGKTAEDEINRDILGGDWTVDYTEDGGSVETYTRQHENK